MLLVCAMTGFLLEQRVTSAGASEAIPGDPVSGAKCRCEFDPAAFMEHVAFLADDRLEGRGLGSKGLELAAEYIARQFKELGIEPGGEDGTYFQTFTVKLRPTLSSDGRLQIAGADAQPRMGQDYIPFPFSATSSFNGPVVFAGYGITHEDKEHDDYVHLDAEGKVVLMLRREPPSWEENGEPTPHAEFRNKIYNAKEHGAAAVLIVNQRPEEGEKDDLVSWDMLAGGALTADFGIPALHVTRELAGRLLDAGKLPSLDELQDKLDKGGFASAELEGVRIEGNPGVAREESPTRNVIGLLPGEGPKASEVLVIGAHYEHLGITVPRTTFGKKADSAEREPAIHNGADDNASGTAGVIELARALKACRPLERSVLFMAFTGEESGLLGSKHLVENPTVPLERMIAMINLDMIGRLPKDSDKIQVFGTKAAEEFEALCERHASRVGFKLQGSGSAFGPSDHTSFYTKKIPAMHVFTGLHTDYHLPADDVEKINAEGATRVLDYVCGMARDLIAAEEPPTYHRVAPPSNTGRAQFRVRMGIMPSYAEDGEGMGVDGVLEDSPAEAAGMKDGDVIVRIGDSQVKNVYDYMGALRNRNPGDEVEVEVLRDGAHVTLKVKLAGG